MAIDYIYLTPPLHFQTIQLSSPLQLYVQSFAALCEKLWVTLDKKIGVLEV